MSVTEKKTEGATTITKDPTLTKSPSKEETSERSVSKDPSTFSKSPVTSMISSEDIEEEDESSTVVPIKKAAAKEAPQTKAKVDYTKRCNNVSIKYLR